MKLLILALAFLTGVVIGTLQSPLFYALLGLLFLYNKELFVGKTIITTALYVLLLHTIICFIMLYYRYGNEITQYIQLKDEVKKVNGEAKSNNTV